MTEWEPHTLCYTTIVSGFPQMDNFENSGIIFKGKGHALLFSVEKASILCESSLYQELVMDNVYIQDMYVPPVVLGM